MNVTQQALDQLCMIAEMAGTEIMAVYQDGGAVWTKTDSSPLTEADLRADRVICDALEQYFPGVAILSEESASGMTRRSDTFFLVDPLDGTKEFIKRNDEFTVNIALITHGRPVAGVVYAPALERMYFAAEGLGAMKRDAVGTNPLNLRVQSDRLGSELRIVGSRSHASKELEAWLQGLNEPYTFLAAGSSLKFCLVAEGLADIYPRFGPTSQWDTAAGQAILEMAGGEVRRLDGGLVEYGLDRPLLNPAFVAYGDSKICRWFQ